MSERKRFTAAISLRQAAAAKMSGPFRCLHCQLSERSHLGPERYCPEWALRDSDGDR